MALTQRLEIRQSHALVMTPQLMQAIKLLQLSNLDLAAYVEGELERNPLLERIGEGDGGGDRRGRGPGLLLISKTFHPPTPMPRPRVRMVRRRRAIPTGPHPAPAAATTATTISKPSFLSRPRLWTISP